MRKLNAALTDEEKQLIKDKWLTLEVAPKTGKIVATARSREGRGIGRTPGQAIDALYKR